MLRSTCFHSGTGRVPDQLVNLDMKHGVEAKNYEEVNDLSQVSCFKNSHKFVEHKLAFSFTI